MAAIAFSRMVFIISGIFGAGKPSQLGTARFGACVFGPNEPEPNVQGAVNAVRRKCGLRPLPTFLAYRSSRASKARALLISWASTAGPPNPRVAGIGEDRGELIVVQLQCERRHSRAIWLDGGCNAERAVEDYADQARRVRRADVRRSRPRGGDLGRLCRPCRGRPNIRRHKSRLWRRLSDRRRKPPPAAKPSAEAGL